MNIVPVLLRDGDDLKLVAHLEVPDYKTSEMAHQPRRTNLFRLIERPPEHTASPEPFTTITVREAHLSVLPIFFRSNKWPALRRYLTAVIIDSPLPDGDYLGLHRYDPRDGY